MNRIDKLIMLAASVGLDILDFKFTTVDHVQVTYHSLKQAGPIPVFEFCRDYTDYDFIYKSWIKMGTILSPEYPNFDAMITGEMRRLKVWAKTLKK